MAELGNGASLDSSALTVAQNQIGKPACIRSEPGCFPRGMMTGNAAVGILPACCVQPGKDTGLFLKVVGGSQHGSLPLERRQGIRDDFSVTLAPQVQYCELL